MTNFITQYLSKAKNENLQRTLRAMTPVSSRISSINGKEYINFSSNDYLGLSHNNKLTQASIKWIQKYGTGSSASRLVTGTNPEYLQLEQRIADWKGTETSLVFGSGFLLNSGLIPALADKNTAIFADKLNHASLNTGCQLAEGKFIRYKHNDIKHLETLIKKNNDFPRKIIISDTIFSMDGDIADLKNLRSLADKYSAFLYLDDAHGTGLYGEKGEGLTKGADFAMGTFSKALGSYGAYIACSNNVKEYIINTCKPFIYTTALPPSVYGSISAAIELIQTSEYCDIRNFFTEKYHNLKVQLNQLGFNTGNTNSPIIPIIIGDMEKTLRTSQYLFENQIIGTAIRPPTVPKDTARIRIALNATHTDDDIAKLIETLNCAINGN